MNELSKLAYKIKNAAPTLSISNSMRRLNYYFKDIDYFNSFAGIPTNSEGEIPGQEPVASGTAASDTKNN